MGKGWERGREGCVKGGQESIGVSVGRHKKRKVSSVEMAGSNHFSRLRSEKLPLAVW